MAGLLDTNTDGGGGLLGSLFNDPGARLGLGLLAASSPRLQGLGQVMAQQDQANLQRQESEWMKAQRDRKMQEWASQDKENALAGQFYRPGSQGVAPLAGDSASGILQSAGRPGMSASFDMQGYAQAMMQVNPQRGMQIMQSLQKDVPVDKIDPKAFTPASLAKFAQSRNYGDLIPRDKLEAVGEVMVNPFDPNNANRTINSPNKPFGVGPDGRPVANTAYQQYEMGKAAAGAARTSNNISVNTEKSLLNTIAGGMGSQIDASLAQAKGASDQLRTIGQLSDVLSSGKVMAGPATKPAMLLTQLGSQLGLAGKDANETLAKTRDAMQKMAQLELDAAAQMKGQGQITESERDIIRRAASGDISMTLPELKTLTQSLEKTARFRIDRHNTNIQPLLANPNAAALAPFLTVQPPTAPTQQGGGVIDFGSLK